MATAASGPAGENALEKHPAHSWPMEVAVATGKAGRTFLTVWINATTDGVKEQVLIFAALSTFFDLQRILVVLMFPDAACVCVPISPHVRSSEASVLYILRKYFN